MFYSPHDYAIAKDYLVTISGVQLISYSSIFEESSKTQIRSALGEILGRRLRPLVFLGVQVHCVKREITLESNKY